MKEVLETAEYVSLRSRSVKIDRKAIGPFCRRILGAGIQAPSWDPHYHFCDKSGKTVSYMVVLDTLNFCFWPPQGRPKWEIYYEAQWLSGYYALAACLRHALEAGIPITSARYLARLSMDELKRIFSGRGELQLMDRRLESLNDLGRVLLESFGGEAVRLVEAAGNSAPNLARLLAREMPSYRDTARYRGQKVFFYKRAQILAADLYGAFEGRDWGGFKDMDALTAFADYKLPQVLRHLGIMRYADSLAGRVDSHELIAPGSEEEIEIRANTLMAVELIRRELERSGHDLRAFEIDWILWNLGQDEEFRKWPYHKTVTVYY